MSWQIDCVTQDTKLWVRYSGINVNNPRLERCIRDMCAHARAVELPSEEPRVFLFQFPTADRAQSVGEIMSANEIRHSRTRSYGGKDCASGNIVDAKRDFV